MTNILALQDAFLLRSDATVISQDPAITAGVKKALAESHCCYFRNVVEPNLLTKIMGFADQTVYDYEDVGALGYRQKEADDQIGSVVRTMLSRPQLLNWMTEVGQCTTLTKATGRFVELRAGGGESLDWHTDLHDRHRRLAIVINFTRNAYEGGDFEMGRMGDEAPFFSFAHFEPGGAMLFKLSDFVMHRVTPVIRGGPRRVFAGWFEANTDLPLAPGAVHTP